MDHRRRRNDAKSKAEEEESDGPLCQRGCEYLRVSGLLRPKLRRQTTFKKVVNFNAQILFN